MLEIDIPNLKITYLTESVLHIHQFKPPDYFSCCDGLVVLPVEGRNQESIILDLNIEPNLIDNLYNEIGPVSTYICSHGHMDHITHVHKWEALGVKIFAPSPEHTYLIDLNSFYEGFGFNNAVSYEIIEKFAKANGYKNCNIVEAFSPGQTFKFENLIIKTIPLLGHSKAHTGFFLPQVKILHISCLGYDLVLPESDGFGPWYGFEECSIDQYIKDIDFVEDFFLNKANFLTTSHSKIIENPDRSPFNYMRDKIKQNQEKVDKAILNLNIRENSSQLIDTLLTLDLFFPKRKIKGFMREIYCFWESGLIKKHLKRSSHFS